MNNADDTPSRSRPKPHSTATRVGRTKPALATGSAILITLLGTARPAWAVQTHGGVEGLVSHQIGHILFAVGIGYLLYRLIAMRLHGPGWPQFKAFLWLLLLWNALTFSGHWLNEHIDRHRLFGAGGVNAHFQVENLADAFFYLTRLDHLLLVPAFILLLLALRKWRVTT